MTREVVQAIDVDERHVECPLCHARVRLPLNDWPVLCDEGEVWLPQLVAVRCSGCRAELRDYMGEPVPSEIDSLIGFGMPEKAAR